MPPQASQSSPNRPPPPPGYFDADAQPARPAPPPGYFDADAQPSTPAATPEQPGFFARASEQLLGTQHPIDQAIAEGKMLASDPVGTLGKSLKQAAMMPVNLANNLVRHPLDTAKEMTGGPQFAEDIANKNYFGAAGTVAGGVLPFLAGTPEGRATVADAMPTSEGIARTMRTEKGTLRPLVRGLSRAGGAIAGSALGSGGAIVGGLTAPSIADALIPDLPKVPEPSMAAKQAATAMPQNERIASLKPWAAKPPEADPFAGATRTSQVTASGPELPPPAPSNVTSTGGGPATLPGPASAPPNLRVMKPASPVAVVPEPTHGDPRWAASVKRSGPLTDMAARGHEGAGQQLQNIGKSVIFTPREGVGYPGPRLSVPLGAPTELPPPAVEPQPVRPKFIVKLKRKP